MNLNPRVSHKPKSWLRTLALAAVAWQMSATAASAHEATAGDVTIEHPYAVPTPTGARTGGMYFRRLKNDGNRADRLIAASTPIARVIEFHEMKMDGDVMKMRALPAIDLPPGQALAVRHGGTLHLMLLDLKQALKDGERFPVTLTFERGGKKEVMVWVQKPREAAAPSTEHRH